MPAIEIRVERCKGCERCREACPQKVIAMSGTLNTRGYNYALVSDGPRCIGCRICAISCPDAAIEVMAAGTRYDFFQY
ncbi:MAG: ferredoxin family protein [Myxococcota bacterium]|jgi:2-oxoglutarate ferredoxin oxidoreductase subunit delta